MPSKLLAPDTIDPSKLSLSMGITHIKASEHSPESKSAVKVTETVTTTVFDRELQPEAGTRRLLPLVFVVEKGKPYTYKALGPSVLYVIEGEYELEDQVEGTGRPIRLTKGDIALADEGSLIIAGSPSKARVFGVTHIEAPKVVTDGLVEV